MRSIADFSGGLAADTPLASAQSNNSEEQTMKSNMLDVRSLVKLTALGTALAVTGCSSSGGKPSGATPAGQMSSKAKADDGRTVDIGKSTPAPGGGVNYKNPHME